MKLKWLGREFSFRLDVKNHINLLEENGVDVTGFRGRYLDLRERVPRDDRAGNAEWSRLEEDVLRADTVTYPGEPSTLDGIKAARPGEHVDLYDDKLSDSFVADRLAGAWRGRIAGCLLGKPVESFLSEEGHRANLRRWMGKAGEYPVEDWVTAGAIEPYWAHLAESIGKWADKPAARACLRGNIRFAAEDDDLRYTVMNLRLLQRYGRDFTTGEAITHRREFLGVPGDRAVRSVVSRNMALGMELPEAAHFMNTGREWLGPQIRADVFGYACPGAPEAAARLAFKEACSSATQNGIYGAMWIAASLASAFVETDVEMVIRRGMEQIPACCRLAGELDATIAACRRNGDDWERTMDFVEARTGHYHCIHAINNCCIIAMALLHGAGDFARSISIAVSVGYDTDCNGAHAGSIAGAMLGLNGIGGHWTEPFNDTLYTGVGRIDPLNIQALIDETADFVRHSPVDGRK